MASGGVAVGEEGMAMFPCVLCGIPENTLHDTSSRHICCIQRVFDLKGLEYSQSEYSNLIGECLVSISR